MQHTTEIQRVRHATRQIVRDLDFMKGSIHRTGCTASEIHTLLELEARGELGVTELAELLRQDKSTASRTVKGLVEQGFADKIADPMDKRVFRLRLTAAGRDKAGAVHDIANRQVGEALNFLNAEDRERAVEGVELYARALQRSYQLCRVELRPIEPSDNGAVGDVIRTVMTEFGAVGSGFSIVDPEVDDICSAYASDRSRYFVAERDGEILGGAGFGPLNGADGSICELRKMFLLSPGRGIGVGRKLLARCLEEATACGYKQCYLETLLRMGQAQELYAKFGFEPLDGPMGDTGHHGCDAWAIKDL